MENSIICVVVVTIIIVIMARFQLDVTPMYLLSEQNAGQKYKYRIMFKLQSCKDIELFFYSDALYKSISAFFTTRFIEKHREYYRFRYQDKTYMIPKEEVEAVEFVGSWNIGWW